MEERELRALVDQVKAGTLSRRRFVGMMVGVGLTAPMAAQMLTWLAAHTTRLGALPEKVDARGRPVSAAPLAWTDAAVLLTLAAQAHPLPVVPIPRR